MQIKNKNIKLNRIRKYSLICLFAIVLRILFMTTFKHEHYNELAENKTYKKLSVQAPRGEIRDRFGRLIAGNKTQFAIQVSGDALNKKNKNNAEDSNRVSLNIIRLLEKNNEEYVDEFPIYYENEKFFYTFDRNINRFRDKNAIPKDMNAKDVFKLMLERSIQEGNVPVDIKNLTPKQQQTMLNENGVYPPVSIVDWKFIEQKSKEEWLNSYGLDKNLSAEEAFKKIRKTKYMNIPDSYDDINARKIMLVKDLIRSKGYTQYSPVTIAKNISEKTISEVEENSINLRGISVAVEQVRYYPNEKLASHILGHVGKIPATLEQKYVEKGYNKEDIVGLQGLEKTYENKLRGVDGYKEVKVDALGRISQEIKSVSPKSGDTMYLTIDSDVQKVAEDSLEKAIKSARSGSGFESKFGNISFGEAAPKANSGAVIAVDIKDGKVLASASYPDFDPNEFAKGISSDRYKELQPSNLNDLLAPNPLLNLVTQGVFQPGSTFKMVTAMAGLENGLNPNMTINDKGVIRLGQKTFADYVWNFGGRNHGIVNMYKALQESCNIYFYSIGAGKDFNSGKDLPIKMGPNKVLEYAKKFGFDEPSGLDKEIEERQGKVPDEKTKLETTKEMLRSDLSKRMKKDFKGIDGDKDKSAYQGKIDTIVSWIDEDKTPGRVETMKRLDELGVKEEKIEEIADLAVFTYFNFAKWSTADTFNLSIGQGENAYNPAQVVRYTASIANGGKLVDLSLLEKTVSSDFSEVSIKKHKSKDIKFDDSSRLGEIKKGMVRVSTQGTAKSVFGNFPIEVASKTGTAEKSGKIPTENEYEYLKSHISYYGVDLSEALKLSDKYKREKERELLKNKLDSLNNELKSKQMSKERREEIRKEIKNTTQVKLEDNDKINAFYLRKAIKELNPKISDDRIDSFKPNYGSFAWAVAFAPADNPEIAIACVIPQGETSNYALLPIREIIGEYFHLNVEKSDEADKNNKVKEKNIDPKDDDFSDRKDRENKDGELNRTDNRFTVDTNDDKIKKDEGNHTGRTEQYNKFRENN